MPSRKPPSARPTGDATVVSRPPEKPGPPVDDLEGTPFSGDTGENPAPSFVTGSDYPAADDAPYSGEEDIYGEDDPFPEDEELYSDSSDRERPRSVEETRIAPITADPDEDEDGVEDENATRAGPPIHLEVISGPDQGRTRRFRGVRMVIGRTHGCDFKLADDSVSRRHLELVLGDDGVLLRDLGSGNGTRVNGEKVNEQRLQDGDEISIGKTRFRFVDELAAIRKRQAEAEAAQQEQASAPADEVGEANASGPDPEPGTREPTQVNVPLPATRPARGLSRQRSAESGPKRKRLLLLGGAAIALLLLIGGAVALQRPAAPPEADPKLAQAAEKMQLARNAFRAEKFEEALAQVDAALALSPTADGTGLGEAARKELAAQQGFEEVRALVQAARFDEARAKLADVPLGTVLGEEARQKLAAELETAATNDLRARVETALEEGDLDMAEALFGRLPREMAVALHPRMEEVRREVSERMAAEARAEARADAARRRAAEERRQAFIDDAFSNVARKFHGGDFQRAALECDRVADRHRSDREIVQRARLLKRWIPQFGRYLDEGTRKFNQGNLEGAARPLRNARALYQKIGFEGALGALLDEQLAASALQAARAALARNDLASAAEQYRQSKALNPSDSRADQGLEIVYGKAEELYLDAYMIRDRDPRDAAAKFRTVMDVLPRSSETWGKAKNQLANLQN